MKPQHWVPVAVFLGVSLPLLTLLIKFEVASEYRVWISIGVGALATAFAQSRFEKQAAQQEQAR